MIILLDTSTSTCFLTIVNGENRQDFEWEAGRMLARNLLKFLEEKTGDLHLISGIGVIWLWANCVLARMKRLLCQSTVLLRISLRRENNFYRSNRQNRV